MPRLTHSIHCRINQSPTSDTICGGSTLWKSKLDSVAPAQFPAVIKANGKLADVRRRKRGNGRGLNMRKVRYTPCGRCVVGFTVIERNKSAKDKSKVRPSQKKAKSRKADAARTIKAEPVKAVKKGPTLRAKVEARAKSKSKPKTKATAKPKSKPALVVAPDTAAESPLTPE